MTTDTVVERPTRRRTPATWVRGGGLSTLVFALPMLVIFGVFSWAPIVKAVVMSFQKTNLIVTSWVGLENFQRVFADPVLPMAIRNTAYFALLALIFGYPVPLIAAVLMSEVRRAKGLYSALAYLPVVVPPVVAVLLWKFFYDPRPEGVFNTIIGYVGIPPQPWLQSATSAMPSLVLEATWAAAGGTVIIYLAALTAVPTELYDAAEVDGASRLGQDLARHDAAAARRPAHHLHPADHRDRPGVPRAVPVHRRWSRERDDLRAPAGLPVRVPEQPRRQLRHGDGAVSLMLAVFLAVMSLIYFRLTRSWSTS